LFLHIQVIFSYIFFFLSHRTQDGKAYRLYTRQHFLSLQPHTTPEIQRSTLITTVLQLKKLRLPNILEFDFVDRPDIHLIKTAIKQLYALEALDDDGNLTKIGSILSQLPISPFLGRVLIASCGGISGSLDSNLKCSVEVLKIIAMLSVEDVFVQPRDSNRRGGHRHSRDDDSAKMRGKNQSVFMDPSGDHLTLLHIYDKFSSFGKDIDYQKKWCRHHFFHYRALSTAVRVHQQLEDLVHQLGLSLVSCRKKEYSSHKLKRKRYDENCDSDDEQFSSLYDSDIILRVFSIAYYAHTAKKHPTKHFFYNYMASTSKSSIWSFKVDDSDSTESSVVNGLTSENRLFALYLSPNSAFLSEAANPAKHGGSLYSEEKDSGLVNEWVENLEWVIYHEVVYSQKATMRVVSAVRFEWVQSLLKRLQEVDEYRLLGITKPEIEHPTHQIKDTLKRDSATPTESPSAQSNEQNNRDALVEAARLRYLERQKKKG
jgi:HrpA-like RNA helicase